MAEIRDKPAARVTPEAVASWVELALMLADRILKLFGRRKSDAPEREKPDTPPPREGPGRREG